MHKNSLAIAVSTLFVTLCAHAGSDAGLDQLLSLNMDDLMALKVKISTNTDQPLSRAPSVVSVITADDIKATGASNITEVLQSVPGIYVRANLFGFRPQITSRGATGSRMLLMLNGAPIRDLVWSSGIFWKGLPTEMVERIEIIRGPGSALFGSDASAGVINVITKTAGRIEQSEVGARAGSFDSQSGWIQHGGNWNGVEIGFSAGLSHTGGHEPYIARDAQTTQDARPGINTNVSLAPGNAHYGWKGQDIHFSAARDHWRLLADYTGHTDLQTGLTGAAVLDSVAQRHDQRLDLGLFYSNAAFSSDWGLNAEVRYHHLDYSSGDGFQERPPGYKDATGTYPDGMINRGQAAERGYVVEASGLYSGLSKHAIRVGLGYSAEDLYYVAHQANYGRGPDGIQILAGSALVDVSDTPYAFAPEKTRNVAYLFLQDIWSMGQDWELTAGTRYDHYSDFGSSWNSRLALVWQTSKRLTTKLMYGEAFRVPTYLELYSPTAANTPNPDLKPERSHTWDLLFSWTASKDLKFNIDLYQFEQSDLIAADLSNKFQNISKRTNRGVELESQWQATQTVRMAANLTLSQESNSMPRNDALPLNKAYLRTDWAFAPKWNWNLQANWIGKRSLPANASANAPLPAYTLVDTTIRHFHNKNWEFTASIRNLFDQDAREYSTRNLLDNLPLPGRSLYAELRYKF